MPRTLRLDQLIRYYVGHQLDVIVRRTTYRLRKANERAHILRVAQLKRRRAGRGHCTDPGRRRPSISRAGLIELLDIDEIQAQAT